MPNYINPATKPLYTAPLSGTEVFSLNQSGKWKTITFDQLKSHMLTDGNIVISGSVLWSNIVDKPSVFSNLISNGDGLSFLSNDGTYKPITVPIISVASTTVSGTVKVDGSTITINNGVISGSSTYNLPTASTDTLGGVKVDGTSITINGSGIISGASTYTLPTASSSVLGGVKIGTGLNIVSGVLSASSQGVTTSDDTTTNGTYYPLCVTATSGSTLKSSSTKLQFNPSTGVLTSTAFNSISDERLKDNIKTLRYGLKEILLTKPVSFKYKQSEQDSIGFLAQDIETIIPELVNTNDQGFKSVYYGVLVSVLCNAIKELKYEIDILKGKIEC